MVAYVENSARPETWARDTGSRACTRPALVFEAICAFVAVD